MFNRFYYNFRKFLIYDLWNSVTLCARLVEPLMLESKDKSLPCGTLCCSTSIQRWSRAYMQRFDWNLKLYSYLIDVYCGTSTLNACNVHRKPMSAL